MCAKIHLLIFSSFLDIWENAEWPRFFWTTRYFLDVMLHCSVYFSVPTVSIIASIALLSALQRRS